MVTAAKSRRPSAAAVARAVTLLAEHGGIKLAPGGGKGMAFTVVIEGGLEVEVAMSVRRQASRTDELTHIRSALEQIELGEIESACACYAKNRDTWSTSKTKDCSKPIAFAVVTQGKWTYNRGTRRTEYDLSVFDYSFRCTHHRDRHDATKALMVVALPKAALNLALTKRRERAEERRKFERMTDVEKIEHDAKLAKRSPEVITAIHEQTKHTTWCQKLRDNSPTGDPSSVECVCKQECRHDYGEFGDLPCKRCGGSNPRYATTAATSTEWMTRDEIAERLACSVDDVIALEGRHLLRSTKLDGVRLVDLFDPAQVDVPALQHHLRLMKQG